MDVWGDMAGYEPERRPKGLRISPTVALQVVAWVVAVLLAYGAMNARMSVVEERQRTTDQRLQRIEDKVDVLLQRSR